MPNKENLTQGNQERIPQDTTSPHWRFNKEISREINEHHNGTPEHETTGNAINQDKNFRYRPRIQSQN